LLPSIELSVNQELLLAGGFIRLTIDTRGHGCPADTQVHVCCKCGKPTDTNVIKAVKRSAGNIQEKADYWVGGVRGA